MVIIQRILLLFIFFCLTIQTTHLWATNVNNNKISFLDGIDNSAILIDSVSDENRISEGVLIDIFKSIPTPLETSILIKDLGVEYHGTHLNSSDNVDNYTNNYKKALNLGVYSIDLGYANNIYEENQDALNYLNSVKKLADGLNIGQFFDYTTIKKLTQSNNDLDSLLQLTTQNFEKINTELHKQKREYLSILILTGGWLESVYITSLVYKDSHNEALKNKIGEQRLVLDVLLLALNVYKDKPNFKPLIDDLEQLQKIYQNVEIVEKDGSPRMEVKDGEIIIVDTKEISVTISDQNAESIINLIASIRNKIVSKNDNQQAEKSNTSFTVIDSTKNNQDTSVTAHIDTILDITPSSLETAVCIREAENNYYGNQLNETKYAKKYVTTYQKALNLGVYHTDLEYTTLYENYQDANDYLQTIEILADSLDIKKFIDYASIKKNTQTNRDLDYLLLVSRLSFVDINEQLAKQNRQEISILILTGSWLESLYITSMVYKKTRNKKLRNKIGENKLSLNEILLVLNIYKDKSNFDGLITELEFLQKKYQEVELLITDGQPKMEVIDGEIVITDTDKTIATVSDSNLFSIINLISSIRNKIITH